MCSKPTVPNLDLISNLTAVLTLLPNKTLIYQFGNFWLETMSYSASSPIYSSEEEEATFYLFIYYLLLLTYFGGAPKSLQVVTVAMKLKHRHLLLGRKALTNLDSILKSRDITLLTKVHLVKARVFPVVINGCESCTIKKSERQRIDAFELWCWRRLLRDPWTAKRSNQSILKEISPQYSLEGLMLKLKFQFFGHLMRKTDSLERP